MRAGYRKIEILVPDDQVKNFLKILRHERALVIVAQSDTDHLKEIYGDIGTDQITNPNGSFN